MNIESYPKHGHQVIRVLEDVRTDPELDELRDIVNEKAMRGMVHIALSFQPTCYPSSRFIAFLISCNRMLTEKQGSLTVIQPNKEIVYILATAGLLTFLRIFSSEDEMAPS